MKAALRGISETDAWSAEASIAPLVPARALPLVRPRPPRLSQHLEELAGIEASGHFSNYGPVNTAFERDLISTVFGRGHCVTVCNATIGLMLAIREVIGEDRPPSKRFALMPSFTFAATAHAAIWCGLTPLLCDIDPKTWLPNKASEEALLQQYDGQVAVVIPYATFGNNLDLRRYQEMSERYCVPVVVDAAASLGSLDVSGKAFGTDFPWPVVFSMHATKVFSVGEGGILYCADPERIARLRCMGSFGFGEMRSATLPGLNSKLTEVAALTASLQLRELPTLAQYRHQLAECYRRELGDDFQFQETRGQRQVRAFESLLLPEGMAQHRPEILRRLALSQIGAGTYFSPHLWEQPYFRRHATAGSLAETEAIAPRLLSLPLHPGMDEADVSFIAHSLRAILLTLAGTSTVSTAECRGELSGLDAIAPLSKATQGCASTAGLHP